MAESKVYTQKGLLVRRPNSPNWYMRFTASSGRHIFKSTKHANYEDALLVAEQAFRLEKGTAHQNWERHLRAASADSRSWLREIGRKVRHRNSGGRAITNKDILEIAKRSGGYCELTGLPFSLDNPTGSRVAPFKPSLDRIDSTKPYSYGNCRLILVAANLALRDWGDSVFRQMCVGYATKVLSENARAVDTNPVSPIITKGSTKKP